MLTTSADGLSKSTQAGSGGSVTRNTTDVTVVGADGGTVETVSVTSANGSLEGRTVTTTSADRLTTTVQSDATGSGTFDTTLAVAANENYIPDRMAA